METFLTVKTGEQIAEVMKKLEKNEYINVITPTAPLCCLIHLPHCERLLGWSYRNYIKRTNFDWWNSFFFARIYRSAHYR